MSAVAPYGSWRSPISAADLAGSGHPVSGGVWVGDDVWWLEARPAEGGRYAVRRMVDGAPVDVLPTAWNARTRVHEYGGGAWAVTDDPALVFAEFSDQRLYILEGAEPIPLTPADEGMRFADLSVREPGTAESGRRGGAFSPPGVRGEVIAVRETHADGGIRRDIVAVPLDGSAANDSSVIRVLAKGSHFLAHPRFSPDGTMLAWIGWEHPQMPWDGTQLFVSENGGVPRVLLGSTTESVLQPEWTDDGGLTVITDRSGWWRVVRVAPSAVGPGGPGSGTGYSEGTDSVGDSTPGDIGGPLWELGSQWYLPLDDGRILAVRTHGSDTLVILDGDSTEPLDLPLTTINLGPRNGDRVLLTGGSSTLADGLRVLDLTTMSLTEVRLSEDRIPDAAYLSIAEPRTFTGNGRDVHAFVYPPKNDDFVAPDGELPPYIALVHGGPTGHVKGALSMETAYFTSRGIGVIDINYGGSSGYGREYRERLKGQWGVVDVEDTITAITGLADAGLADPKRLAIRGGSAGGFTVLAALTSSDVFAAGASYYGISDLRVLAEHTHDFESRYTDGLIGPLPEASAIYLERSPLSHIDRLATPVLLLQGLDDEVVPPAQAELFRDALAARGLPHAYLVYEGESHGFRQAATIIHSTEAELSFYGQVLGFEPVEIPVLPLA
jgi:dipeptidyl aminopeptidase/acylaminoacyl peptidase